MMTHRITLPMEWSQQDAFHDYLWKKFPLDRFVFVRNEGPSVPEYTETTYEVYCPSAKALVTTSTESYATEITEAIEDFLSERKAA